MANVEKSNLAVTVKLSQLESCISDDVYLRLCLETTQTFSSPLVRGTFCLSFVQRRLYSLLVENRRGDFNSSLCIS